MKPIVRFIVLISVIFVACRKDPGKASGGEIFQQLQLHTWKLDSIVFVDNDQRMDVSIPPTAHSQYIKFTSSQIEHYYSSNADPLSPLTPDAAVYKSPAIIEAWYPGRTSGPPSYKVEVVSVSDTRLRYNFLNTPDYVKSRVYYYHAY